MTETLRQAIAEDGNLQARRFGAGRGRLLGLGQHGGLF